MLAADVVGGSIRKFVYDADGPGETGQMLSKRVNGHRSTCKVANSDLPVPIQTQSHQLPFQECWLISVIHKLPDDTPDHVCCQFEMAYQLAPTPPISLLISKFDNFAWPLLPLLPFLPLVAPAST